MVMVVDDFDSGFVDFGCGGGMMFDFLFFFCGFDGCGGGDGGCCGTVFDFFFFLWVWLYLVVVVVVVVVGVVVVVAVAYGRGGCGWCCFVFLGSGIYYIIVDDILFYCEVYIILLY